jgi:hypothetical protein
VVNPYVMGVIRLADRRGLLTGSLSLVQDWGLRVLIAWEEDRDATRRTSERIDQARASLLLLNPHGLDPKTWFRALYPDFFGQAEVEYVEVEVDERDIEGDSSGRWDFSQSMTDADEIEAVLRNMGQTSRMTLAEADAVAPDDDDEGWM